MLSPHLINIILRGRAFPPLLEGPMLKTEKNTKAMEQRILRAARKTVRFPPRKGRLVANFEHGQWWVTQPLTGAQWSVVDAEGGHSVDGFDFEQVTEGDDEN